MVEWLLNLLGNTWSPKSFYQLCFVFCLVVLGCGGSASQNCTYLVQSSVTTLTSPCAYTICPASSNICRIRFDFTVSTNYCRIGELKIYVKWVLLNQLCMTSLFTKQENSLIFSSLKKSSFPKWMLLLNFPIQWSLNWKNNNLMIFK